MQVLISIAFTYAVVIVHELGHYYATKYTGVHVTEVCIGNGPRLFSRKAQKTGTAFTVRLLPFSGYNYVQMIPDGCRRRMVRRKSFDGQPNWKQVIILSAGCLANAIGAIVIACYLADNSGCGIEAALQYGIRIFSYTAVLNLVPIGKTDGARLFKLLMPYREKADQQMQYRRWNIQQGYKPQYTWSKTTKEEVL